MRRLRILWRRLRGWELTLRAVLPNGRIAWTVAGVVDYRPRPHAVYVRIATPTYQVDGTLDLPHGARLEEIWTRRARGKPVRYGM